MKDVFHAYFSLWQSLSLRVMRLAAEGIAVLADVEVRPGLDVLPQVSAPFEVLLGNLFHGRHTYLRSRPQLSPDC